MVVAAAVFIVVACDRKHRIRIYTAAENTRDILWLDYFHFPFEFLMDSGIGKYVKRFLV